MSKKRKQGQEMTSKPDRPQRLRARAKISIAVVGAVLVAGAAVLLAGRAGWISTTDPLPTQDSAGGVPSPTEPIVVKSIARDDVNPVAQVRDDPAADGWQSEAFHLEVREVLGKLGKLIGSSAEIDEDACRPLVVPQFHCEPLVPTELVTVYENKGMRVERRAAPTQSSATVPSESPSDRSDERDVFRGADGLAHVLRQLAAPLRRDTDVRIKFKIVRVDLKSDSAITEQYVSLYGRTAEGLLEQHATWLTTWKRRSGAAPQLASIRVKEFEQVRTLDHRGPLFSDCTESVLAGNASYEAQILRGHNHWMDRTQESLNFFILGTPGIALGDVNLDGRDDLYVCQVDGSPNLLLIAQPDGTLKDVSASWGANWLHNSRSALFIDWDNDGDQDLAVAVTGGVILASNEDGKRFSVRRVLPVGRDIMSLAAADYDNDGRLDLYVCCYHPESLAGETSMSIQGGNRSGFVVHDANDGAPNRFFRNEGGWHFRDVTREVGLDMNNRRWSFAAVWEDFDNDGDQDLYVANDYGRDNLYRNDPADSPAGGRRFVDVAETAGAEDSAGGMGVTCGDFDRDGWMDVHVSNMFSSAGNRITRQGQFKAKSPAHIKRRVQRLARGNTLLKNLGDGSFQNVSAPAGVEMGRWAWGSKFADLNNDGWEDLLVANGYITGTDTRDL